MNKTKTALIFTLVGTVAFFGALWIYSSKTTLTVFDITVAVVVVLVTIAAIIIARSRLQNERIGLPADDELSTIIRDKAAAKSFAASFYVWVIILLMSIKKYDGIEVPIGAGILFTGLIFLGYWFFYSKSGVDYENQD